MAHQRKADDIMEGNISWQKGAQDWPETLTWLEINPFRTALVIVDISDNVHQSFHESLSKVLPNIIQLRNFFRESDLRVIYVYPVSFLPDGRDNHVKRRLTNLRVSAAKPPGFDADGNRRHQPRKDLKPWTTELVIEKNSKSPFNSSAMDHHLRAMDVQNLVICGVATSRCVDSTARDAADRGYNTILVEDACADSVPEAHQATIRTFSRLLGSVKSTSEVIADFSGLLAAKRPTVLEVK